MMPPPLLKNVAKSAARALMFASPMSSLSHPPHVSSDAVMIALNNGVEPEVKAVALNAVASEGSTVTTGDTPIAVSASGISVP